MPQRIVEGVAELRGLVGQEVGVSDWFPVTQELIKRFAEVTGDRQWIHVDVERARAESPFGTTIAHGFLTLALLTRLHTEAVRLKGDWALAVNYGLNRVRFPSPVPAGARIRARSKLQGVEDIPGGVQVVWAISVEVEGGTKPVLVAEWVGRLYSRA